MECFNIRPFNIREDKELFSWTELNWTELFNSTRSSTGTVELTVQFSSYQFNGSTGTVELNWTVQFNQNCRTVNCRTELLSSTRTELNCSILFSSTRTVKLNWAAEQFSGTVELNCSVRNCRAELNWIVQFYRNCRIELFSSTETGELNWTVLPELYNWTELFSSALFSSTRTELNCAVLPEL